MKPLSLLFAALLVAAPALATHAGGNTGMPERGHVEDEELTEEQALKVFCDDPHKAICSVKGGLNAREEAHWSFERQARDIANEVAEKVWDDFCKQGIALTKEELYAIPQSFVRFDSTRRAAFRGDTPRRAEPKEDDDEKPKCTGPRKKNDLKPGEPYKAYLNALYKKVRSMIRLPADAFDAFREGVAKGLVDSKRFPADLVKRFDKSKPPIHITGDAVFETASPEFKSPITGEKGDDRVLADFQASCREDGMNFNGFYKGSYHMVTLCPGFLLKLALRKDEDDEPPFPIRKGLLCNTIAHESGHGADWGQAPGAYERFFSCLAAHFNKPDGHEEKDPKRLARDWGHEITADYWGGRGLAACYQKETDRKKLMSAFRDAFETLCDVQADNAERDGAHNHPDGSYRIAIGVEPFREKMGCEISAKKPRCGLNGEEEK